MLGRTPPPARPLPAAQRERRREHLVRELRREAKAGGGPGRASIVVVAAASIALSASALTAAQPRTPYVLGPVTQVGSCALPLEASYPDPAPSSLSLGFGEFSEGVRRRPGFPARVAALWTGSIGGSGAYRVPGQPYAWVSHRRAEFTQRCRRVTRGGAAVLGSLRRWTGEGEISCLPRVTRIVLRVRAVEQADRRVGTQLSVVGRTGRVIVVARVVRDGAVLSYDGRVCSARPLG